VIPPRNPDIDRFRAAADKAATVASTRGELLARHHRWFYRTWIALLLGFVAITVLYVVTLSQQQDQVAGNAVRIGQTRNDATVAKRRATAGDKKAQVAKARADVAAAKARASKARADAAAVQARQIILYLRGKSSIFGVRGKDGKLGTPGPAGGAGGRGPKGDPGAPSTVPGSNGQDGQDSTVPGPAGPASTVPGPAGPASTVPGPAGPASTVPGPAGPACPPGYTLTPEQIATMAGVRDVVLCERTP